MNTDIVIQQILAETKEKVNNIHRFDPITYPLWDTLTTQEQITIMEREHKREMEQLNKIHKERIYRVKKRLEELEAN